MFNINISKNVSFDPKVLTNAARPDNTQTWETLIGHSILIEFDLRFCTNFPYGIHSDRRVSKWTQC